MSLSESAYDKLSGSWLGLYALMQNSTRLDVLVDGLVVVNSSTSTMHLSRTLLTQQMIIFVRALSNNNNNNNNLLLNYLNNLSSEFLLAWILMILILIIVSIFENKIRLTMDKNKINISAAGFSLLSISLFQGMSLLVNIIVLICNSPKGMKIRMALNGPNGWGKLFLA